MITDAQVAEIKAAKEKLMESAQKLFTKMYEQQQAAGAAGAQGAGPRQARGRCRHRTDSADDDVVDGDYKEV